MLIDYRNIRYGIVKFVGWCIMDIVQPRTTGPGGLKLQCIVTDTFSSYYLKKNKIITKQNIR